MIALRGAIHGGVFSSFMFYDGRLAMPPTDVSVWEHATLLFCAGGSVKGMRREGDKRHACDETDGQNGEGNEFTV